MKKRIVLFVLLSFVTFVLSAGELKIPKEYLGTYLSVDYINLLQKYKNHEKALKEIYQNQYDVLFLSETKCYTNYTHHEGSYVSNINLSKWNYKTENNNLYITDENGYLYKRISKQISENAFYKYVAGYIFGLFPDCKVEIKDNTVNIDKIVYKIKLEPNHPREPVPEYAIHLYIFDDKVPEVYDYFLILENDGFKVIKGININDRWYKPLPEEVVYTYKKLD